MIVTDEMVEAAARAAWESEAGRHNTPWDEVQEERRVLHRAYFAAGLRAALATVEEAPKVLGYATMTETGSVYRPRRK